MPYLRLFITTLLLASPASQALAQGSVSGTIVDVKTASALPSANVHVFDAVNAEIVSKTTTDESGNFMALVPSGTYKIRVDATTVDTKSGAHVCYAEFLGDVIPDSGGNILHADVFDTAKAFVVNADPALADGSLAPHDCEFSVCVLYDPLLEGVVMDSETGVPINGIVVRAKDSVNAMPRIPDLESGLKGVDGGFTWGETASCGVGDVKVRFHDPQGRYAPEYYSDKDDAFSAGNEVHPDSGARLGQVLLSRVSAPDRLADLADQVSDLPITDEARNSLTHPIGQAETLLRDENPNNDKAACGLLKAFINGLDGAVTSGKITAAQRDVLVAAAEAIQQELNCKI